MSNIQYVPHKIYSIYIGKWDRLLCPGMQADMVFVKSVLDLNALVGCTVAVIYVLFCT